jgi:tetratricopeptide (TPR) repeat protein
MAGRLDEDALFRAPPQASLEAQRSVGQLLQMAEQFMKQGEWKEAMKCLNQITLRDGLAGLQDDIWTLDGPLVESVSPEVDLAVLSLSAECLFYLGQLEKSKQFCDAALKRDSNLHVMYHIRGRINYGMSNFQQAIADFSRFIDYSRPTQFPSMEHFDQSLRDVLLLRGSAYLELADYQSCIKDMDRIIKDRPDQVDAIFTKGCALVACRKSADALPLFDRVLGFDSRDFRALFSRSLCLVDLSRFHDALEDANFAVQVMLDDRSGAVPITALMQMLLHRAGIVSKHRGDYLRGLEMYREAHKKLSETPGSVAMQLDTTTRVALEYQCLAGQVNCSLALHRYHEAGPLLDRLLELAPNNSAAKNNKAYCSLMTGDSSGALKMIIEALRADRTNLAPIINEAVAMHKQGNFAQAAELLEAVRKIRSSKLSKTNAD